MEIDIEIKTEEILEKTVTTKRNSVEVKIKDIIKFQRKLSIWKRLLYKLKLK